MAPVQFRRCDIALLDLPKVMPHNLARFWKIREDDFGISRESGHGDANLGH